MTAPAHAAKIWTVGDTLHIEFPSSKTEKVHTISVPANALGLTAAVAILHARTADSTVATRGAPLKTQTEKRRQLEKLADDFLKSGGRVKKPVTIDPALKASAVSVLKDLGII